MNIEECLDVFHLVPSLAADSGIYPGLDASGM
jgi:hypothetical protein